MHTDGIHAADAQLLPLFEQRSAIQGGIYSREIGTDWQQRVVPSQPDRPDGTYSLELKYADLERKYSLLDCARPTPDEQAQLDDVDRQIAQHRKEVIEPLEQKWRESFTIDEHRDPQRMMTREEYAKLVADGLREAWISPDFVDGQLSHAAMLASSNCVGL